MKLKIRRKTFSLEVFFLLQKYFCNFAALKFFINQNARYEVTEYQ